MDLLEKKKIVAKWMGWEIIERGWGLFVSGFINLYIEDWHPESDRNTWPGLWGNMDDDFIIEFDYQLKMQVCSEYVEDVEPWTLYTISTEKQLTALVEAIQQREGK